jgi:hypothetical protein
MRLAKAPLRGAAAGLERGRAAERRTRAALSSAADQALLGAVDIVLDRLLSDDVIDRVVEQVEASGLAERVAARMLEDGIAERIADRALAGPELERIVASALQSALFEETVAQLLETRALWVLVDEIARSPSVTEAITHQSTGFVEEVGDRARDRSRKADAWVERVVRRVSRRGDDDLSGGTRRGPALPAEGETG